MHQPFRLQNLPVSTPTTPLGERTSSRNARRDDGSFDLTQFFANFDLNSEVARCLQEFDPARFCALLRIAASPLPDPPKTTSSLFQRRRSEPFQTATIDYQRKLEERNQARTQLNKDLEALDKVVEQMEALHVPGIEQLKEDFTATKAFIFDAIANSKFRALDIHLEFDEGASTPVSTPGIPPTPPSPQLRTIPLPVVTPVPTPGWNHTLPSGSKWPPILLGANGLAYRVVATPCQVESESAGYFSAPVTPPTPIAASPESFRSLPKESLTLPTAGRPVAPVFGRRPTWIRRLSSLGTPHSNH